MTIKALFDASEVKSQNFLISFHAIKTMKNRKSRPEQFAKSNSLNQESLVSDYSIQSHSGESSECFSGDWQ
jgi:hypothetical protein